MINTKNAIQGKTITNKPTTIRSRFSIFKLLSVLSLVVHSFSANSQPWTYNFGTTTGSHTSSTASTSFLPTPTSGTARVRVGTNPGSITLLNPGIALGTGSELQITSNTSSSSTTKFSVFDYTTATKVGYVKFTIAFNGGTNGVYQLAIGDGANFSDNNAIGAAQIYSGIRWSFGAANAITYNVLNGSTYGTTGISSSTTLFSQSTSNSYIVEAYFNNETTTQNYSRIGSPNSMASGTWDLWIDGTLIGNDIARGGIGNNVNIDSWAFNHQSSSSSPGTVYLDDIEYSNALPIGGTPSIAFLLPTIPTTSVDNNSTNNIIGAVQLDVITASASLNAVTFTTAGTYTASDIATNGFKFWLSTSATDISSATQLGAAQVAATSGSNITVSGLSNTITSGTTRYIVLSADIAVSPTSGATLGITSTAHSNITFASGTKTGTDPVAAGNTRTISVATPSVAISSNHPIASSISQNSVNQNFGSIALAVTTANTTLNSVTITTGGTYQTSDLVAASFKLYYTTTNTFATTTQLGSGQAIVATGNTITFSGLSQTINSGTTGYLWFIADVAYNAINGRTLTIASTVFSNITFASGNKTGMDPIAVGNDHTITTVTPNVTIVQAGPLAGSIATNATNQILYQLSCVTADNATDINSLTVTTAGTYIPADLTASSFKLWYNTANNLTGAIQLGIGQAIVTTGNNITFSGLAQKFNIGTSYLLLTVDVASGATAGNTINITSTVFSNITLSAGNKLGTDPSSSGGAKTIATDVAVGDVVINQFSPDYNGASNEYVEIVNKTSNTIDLSTLKLAYQSATGTLGGAGATLSGNLAPYSFWLLSPDASITVGLTSSLIRDGSFTAGFAGTSGQLAIQRLSDNTIIDAVGYGSLTGGTFSEGTASSSASTDGGLRRATDGADANVNSTDFTTVTNANIYLRNSSSRLGIAGSTIGAGTYTDFVVTGNTSLSGAVNVTNRLSLISGTLSTGANLTLKSSSTGTANIPAITGAILGNVNVERFIPAQTDKRYRFLSSPVSSTVADWRGEIFITGGGVSGEYSLVGTNNVKINGLDWTASGAPSMYSYTENLNSGGLNTRWEAISSGSTTLIAGKGYRVFIRGDRSNAGVLDNSVTTQSAVTITSTGTINTGSVTLPVTYSGSTSNDGWNLVGNPYPCSIDFTASSGWTKTNIGTGVAIFRPLTNSYAYSIASSDVSENVTVAINGGSNIIASGQAFWVRAIGSSPVLSCTEAVKVTSASPTVLFKTNPKNQLRLILTQDSTNIDETVIAFGSKFNDDFIENEDVNKLANSTVNVSTIVGVEKYAAINFTSSNYKDKVMPLSVWGNKNGIYQLTISQVETFDAGVSIYLKDKILNTITAIGESKSINIELNDNSKGDDRFEVIFSNNSTSVENILNISSLSVYPNPAIDLLNISLSNETVIETVNIFDVSGKLVNIAKVIANQINISELNNGVYFIEVLTENGKLTTKFVK